MNNVNVSRVVFAGLQGLLAGRLHQPGSVFERRPGVVVTGSWLTVKEQMPDHYAARLAERGWVALTFDFTGWGQSAGAPRHAELPEAKVADIAAAARYLASRSSVRPGGVTHLGICASAQYGLAAVAAGAPIASFVAVAGWFHDVRTVAPFYGGENGVEDRLHRADAAAARYLDTGEVVTVPAYADGDDRAGMALPLDYYADAARGAVPTWPNEMAELSWRPWLTFDGLAAADRVSVPALLVHADGCVFPDTVRSLPARLSGPTKLVWGTGTQTDFYDRVEQVTFALAAIEAHFGPAS